MRTGIGSRRAAAGVVVAAVLASGCASAKAVPVVSRGTASVLPAADPRPYGIADTAFGLDVLRAWCQADPRQNLLFSPASLATGLGMAYLGARGATAQAMASVLHLPAAGGRQLAAGLQSRTAALGRLGGPGVTVAASNLVWADPKLSTSHSYLNSVATSYAAGVDRAPLLTDPQQAADVIDQAISDATDGKIPRLLEPGMLRDIGWVLTSALYLNAAWATPFQADATKQQQFTTAAGTPVTAHFMHAGGLGYGTADGWAAVSLPYQGGKLRMVALLPPRQQTAGDCAVPSAAALGTLSAAGSGQAAIALPKVNLTSAGSMNSLLKTLGMSIAFSSTADFTALSPQACCIGFVQQAATLQVGEKGTVGAAAAAVGIEPSSGIVITGKQVVFDRPYLLLVTSSDSEPLFLARVADPVTSREPGQRT